MEFELSVLVLALKVESCPNIALGIESLPTPLIDLQLTNIKIEKCTYLFNLAYLEIPGVEKQAKRHAQLQVGLSIPVSVS